MMGEMLSFNTIFDSEDSTVSSTRPGNLLVDSQAILAVSDTSTEGSECSIVFSFSTTLGDGGQSLNRWVLVPRAFDEVRMLLAKCRVVLPMPHRALPQPGMNHPNKKAGEGIRDCAQTNNIKVHDGWYGEQNLSLPEQLADAFRPGFKFHVDENYFICPDWKEDNAERNYILEYVEYYGNEASTCISSERDLAMQKQRKIAGQIREDAVKQAKALIKAGRGAFEVSRIEQFTQEAESALKPEPLTVFRKYVARVPVRLGPLVGDHMLGGKSFEESIELGSAELVLATQKKLASLLKIKKNCRV